MTIGRRLYISFAVLIVFFIVLNIYSLNSMKNIKSGADEIADVWMKGIEIINKADNLIPDYRAREYMHITTKDDKFTAEIEAEFPELEAKFQAFLDSYLEVVKSEKEKVLIDRIKSEWQDYLVSHEKLLALSRINKDEEATAFVLGESRTKFLAVNSSIEELTVANNGDADKINQENNESYNSTRLSLLILIIMLSIMSIAIAAYIGRHIVGRIRELGRTVEGISRFELIENSEEESKKSFDEIGVLEHLVQDMKQNLRSIVSQIKLDSDTVELNSENVLNMMMNNSQSLEEVGKATDELAQGSADLAGHIQHGVMKLDQLSERIDQSVDNSNTIRNFMAGTSSANAEGMHYVQKLAESVEINSNIAQRVGTQVEVLNQKSESIGKVVEAINSITEQINLLSLNATIEAARAGEYGRGFAVVADEIRKLANEAAHSTKEIEAIIESVKQEVESTKLQVAESIAAIDQTGRASEDTKHAFVEIEEQVSGITEQLDILIGNISEIDRSKAEFVVSMEEISAISEESAAATEEISTSIEQQITNIEQVSESAGELNQVAKDLEDLVNQFTT